jgi:RNA polymerase sigma-70 factor (ECF subfamily)
MTALDDAALTRAAQAGDVAGLGVLLERHRALLHAVAVGMLGHGPAAEDAVHDTFLIALRRIGELREPAAVRGWLLAILGNVCRAELRRPAADPVAEPPAAQARVVDEAIERLALRDWVWTALERLSEPLRLVVLLRHFSGASSYEAIAELCGVPVGTVRSRLYAARAKLADELLETAAAAHRDAGALRELVLAQGAAMTAFQRSGDAALLRDVVAPDVEFFLADRIPRRGRDVYAALLAADFADGVTSRVRQVIPGASMAVVELWLDSPGDDPLHCPPAVTQVQFHAGGVVHRIATHYAAR